ncbi:MAG: PfkB family carbohydrate kinase [Patescibacteria group bacterium]|nr:PfkB family carbohydrate kinase [Patescibacteria group bacterium]
MLIITGTIAYDYIMDFPGSFSDHILPDQIHKINLSFIVNKFARRRGGTAGNVSYSLGLLKTPHTLFTYAGKDFEDYGKTFTKLGVSLHGVSIDKKNYTSTGFAMADKSNNQIWGYFYGASDNIPNLKLKKVAGRKDLILIGPAGAYGSMSFVKQCVKLGIDYMFDPGFILTQVTDEDLTIGVTNSKFIIGNDYEISLIKNRVKNWKKNFSSKVVITTLGEKGAVIEEKGKIYRIKPIKVQKAVDPTGAGDAWRSGFLAGVERRFSLETCGQMGSVAASFAVEKYGSQEHFYSIDEFKNRYRKTYKSLIDL